MRGAGFVFALILASLAAAMAWAGETRCWVDNGVVLAPAALGDIAGDFILDLSSPVSVLHDTRAQGEGIEGTSQTATLRLAGMRIDGARFQVASLDARSWGFPTTISGLIGADVLRDYVVDLQLSPCRLGLWRRRAPALGRILASLPLAEVAGVPTIAASVSDGHRALAGRFAVDTGSRGVRLSDRLASLSRAPKGVDTTSRTAPPARLDALGVDDVLLRNLPAALATDAPASVSGGLGTTVWTRYALRIDLRRGRLELAPSPSWGGTDRASGRGGGVGPRR